MDSDIHTDNYSRSAGILPKNRGKKIVDILTYHNADIIALQEVDKELYGIVNQYFVESKYGVFYANRNGNRPDGLVIAYRQSKFEELSRDTYSYDTLAKQSSIKDEAYLTNHIAQCIRLKLIPSLDSPTLSPVFTVYNTHLFWNPARDDVKYFQFASMINVIINNAKSEGSAEGFPSRLIILGDFNSLPNSNALQLISTNPKPIEGRIETKYGKEKILENCLKIYEGMDMGEVKRLGLKNAYEGYGKIALRKGGVEENGSGSSDRKSVV